MNTVDTVTALSGQTIVDLTKRHTIFEWSAQAAVDPIPVAGAKGCWFWTPEGKRYLDFNSQLMCVNIGHADDRVVRAIQRQAEVLPYANPFLATEPRAKLGAMPRLPETAAPRSVRISPNRLDATITSMLPGSVTIRAASASTWYLRHETAG